MPSSCSAYGCKNRHNKDNPRQFFKFPLNNTSLLKLWIDAIKRKDLTPTKASKICSDHFLESDYLKRPGTYVRRLKPDSVPSIFPNFPLHLKKKVAVARKDKKRPVEICDPVPEENEDINEPDTPEVQFILSLSVSASTQTDNAPLNLSPTKTVLRRNIKSLRQKLRRRDEKINNLEELITVLKKRINEDKSSL